MACSTGFPCIPGYELIEELGRGGMGVVFLARQQALNRRVAVKTLFVGARPSSETLLRFRAEAEAVAAITHPNVVQVFKVGKYDGRPYMALEYCNGGRVQSLYCA